MIARLDAHPLRLLEDWLDDARSAGLAQPASVAFVTADEHGRPSARTVTLKRVEAESLVFTSALWTRKAREIAGNPHVALLFHWPSLGRQVHVSAEARVGPRALAEELFDARDVLHRWQAIVSRQGEPIEDLEPPLPARRRRLDDPAAGAVGVHPRPPDGTCGVTCSIGQDTSPPDRRHSTVPCAFLATPRPSPPRCSPSAPSAPAWRSPPPPATRTRTSTAARPR